MPEDNKDGMEITDITSDSAKITWKSKKPAFGCVAYGIATASGQATQPEDAMCKEHTATISDLKPETRYFINVQTKDENGNVVGVDDEFTTAKAGTRGLDDKDAPKDDKGEPNKGPGSSNIGAGRPNLAKDGKAPTAAEPHAAMPDYNKKLDHGPKS